MGASTKTPNRKQARATKARERQDTREGPEGGEKAKARGSLQAGQRVLPRSTDTPRIPITVESGEQAQDDFIPDLPVIARVPLSIDKFDPKRYRTPSMKNVGRDADGKTIPHKRDEDTARLIAHWTGMGAELNYIAAMLNVRPGILREHYHNELMHGATMANIDMAGAVFKAGLEGDMTAAKFFLKSRAKWREGDDATGKTDSLLNIHIHT